MQTTASTTQAADLGLAPGIHACCTHGKNVVVLDLHRDRYRLLDTQLSRTMIELWPGLAPERAVLREGTASTGPVSWKDLLTIGVLTLGDGTPPRSPYVALPLAARSREAGRPRAIPSARLRQTLFACTTASWLLKSRPLASTVARVVNRRAVATRIATGPATVTAPSPAAWRLIDEFLVCRSLYPAARVCLRDSLSLIEFLAVHDCFPHWVFGVRTTPFQAHCWVQDGDVVLNDRLDYVRTFAPIMVA